MLTHRYGLWDVNKNVRLLELIGELSVNRKRLKKLASKRAAKSL
jgi:hypothetical protein